MENATQYATITMATENFIEKWCRLWRLAKAIIEIRGSANRANTSVVVEIGCWGGLTSHHNSKLQGIRGTFNHGRSIG